MITIGNVVEVCNIINEASSKLTMIIGEQVELRLITPALPGIEYNQQVITKMDREIMIHTILHSVCEQYMISIANLRGPSKLQSYCDARKSSALILHTHVVDMTDSEIGALLNMDRTTALYNRNQAEDLMLLNDNFSTLYNRILKRIKKALANNG
ncbi:helix-turn-helix domain-containing protein [Mucilaginibacter sp.]|uniref:helix-turn-helix domain-containing protein n=1 Tax=Mucilaginibacter sp. TaxID=1882438 RepID=UPI000CB51A19|nr:helix-turn-helix domain-containing protein [Mucilaginibacter sp.]PLW90012.1 MAG: hypothetical protein C0154_08800 [Mucilaginibacter sp.]PMP65806.1 MAG: hypothetical protein C0191_02790 [Mucilaginibacter sp.]